MNGGVRARSGWESDLTSGGGLEWDQIVSCKNILFLFKQAGSGE